MYDSLIKKVLLLVFISIIFVLLYKLFNKKIKDFFTNDKKIFKAPPSFTRVSVINNKSVTGPETPKNGQTINSGTGKVCEVNEIIKLKFPDEKIIYKGNILSYPGFFHVNEKWPGCLPRPLFQGTCGSCWGFASVTVLGSRFYIESCGLAGCLNYPQINFGSLNSVYDSINDVYKFRHIYLTDVFKYIDIERDSKITIDEWLAAVKEYCRLFREIGTPFTEKHYIEQVLNYILDFQSLGSIDIYDCEAVMERAKEVFDIWKDYTDIKDPKDITDPDEYLEKLKNAKTENVIDLTILEQKWKSEPISLSAEKIIACCVKCVEQEFMKDPNSDNLIPKVPTKPTITVSTKDSKDAKPTPDTTSVTSDLDLICIGGSLEDAWATLKNSGTPTAACIGYNMDSYQSGSGADTGADAPTCRLIQGPYYSFCSGYSIIDSSVNLDDTIKKFEDSGIDPIAIPSSEGNLPWTNPQLFVFKAKNVYKIKNDVYAIQREILERGPISTGFQVYPDFQYDFGTDGLGGQKFIPGTNPLGSTASSLIYKWSGKGESLGGHAITIVGWGTYLYDPSKDPSKMQPLKMQPSTQPTTHPSIQPSIQPEPSVPIKIPYWICLNSWGYKWGTSGFAKVEDRTKEPYRLKNGGYFWMLRGVNECDIENNVIVGQPDLENITYPGVVEKYGWTLPSPSPELVEYISQTHEDTLPNGMKFIYKNDTEGGSTYINKVSNKEWMYTSMQPPSPYTLFWYDQDRPIFCLGTTQNEMDAVSTDTTIILAKDSIIKLNEIIKIQKNPLFVIENEQLQFNKIINETTIKVFRAVNNSVINSHLKDSKLKVIPFKDLSIQALERILEKCN